MESFEYKIYNNVYDEMINGKKNTEYRLLNDKSNRIKIGDEIKFIVLNEEKKYILAEVINKNIYNSVEELWNHKETLNNVLNYTKEDFINAFYEIFGKENVINSKIVGIVFKIKEIK